MQEQDIVERITELIEKCHINNKKEKMTQTSEYLCKHFQEAYENQQHFHEAHKQAVNQLIDLINKYINYPTNRILIFNLTKQATAKKDYDSWHNEFLGYKITIPYINTQEYHCIITILEKNKHTTKSYERNKWWLY